MIRYMVGKYMQAKRQNRRKIFLDYFEINEQTRILDLGSEGGSAIHSVLDGLAYTAKNIFIADLDAEAIRQGSEKYGFTPVLIPEDGPLPFDDGYFDIVYCSSVIEHVTVQKDEVYKIRSSSSFRDKAARHQKQFANNLKKLGRQYYVQTPNRRFILESHTWLPFVGWLPRPMQIDVIKFFNKFWVKKTNPDFHLLGEDDMKDMFPEALILPEKSLGMVKSWMVIKSDRKMKS